MADSTTLLMSRVVAISPPQAYTAWTDPAILARWWWPEKFETKYQVDLRSGGRYRYRTGDVPGLGVLSLTGSYLEVAPAQLRYTWDWEDGERPSEVSVEFAEHPNGTEIRLAHRGFANIDQRDNHVIGWTDCLDRLCTLFPER